ncbi:hypothetical protein GARC_4964 [Paraglaciecola arctica BSs20135]|uniref:Uncharacterized protein n=1 Tax=Paraglaciecola arctica BSs20135 TaxID=493475 RepID=K6XMM9_9ALTE|nr:hypothetical protein GARC_4964 [Paraglaciecola arctica BSs20135]
MLNALLNSPDKWRALSREKVKSMRLAYFNIKTINYMDSHVSAKTVFG